MSNDENERKTDNRRAGYVYVASSDSIRVKWSRDYEMPFKIGSATDVDNRIGNLNSAVPIDFRVWLTLKSEDRIALENVIHEELANFRYPKGSKNTEFFVCDLPTIKKAVDSIIKNAAVCSALKLGKVVRDVKTAHCGRSAAAARTNRKRLYSGAIKFICTNNGTYAKGWFVMSEGKRKFIVEGGARCNLTPAPNFQVNRPLSNGKLRDALLASGKIDQNGVLTEAYVFDSPSAAASIITASTRNGNDVWRELLSDGSEGKTLGFFLTGTDRRTKRC